MGELVEEKASAGRRCRRLLFKFLEDHEILVIARKREKWIAFSFSFFAGANHCFFLFTEQEGERVIPPFVFLLAFIGVFVFILVYSQIKKNYLKNEKHS